jgi:D-alanyl-D-alanine dipeptidase
MDGYERPQVHPNSSTQPLLALEQAFKVRQLLTYREGETLVVNDPYLRQRVDVTCNERWFCWRSPAGELEFADRHSPGEAVDQIIRQYAGIYMEERGNPEI